MLCFVVVSTHFFVWFVCCLAGLRAIKECFDDITIWCTKLLSKNEGGSTVFVFWGGKPVKKSIIDREVITSVQMTMNWRKIVDFSEALSKPRRSRQRESRSMAVHVRYKSLWISLPSSVKQEREMTKFCAAVANFSYFVLELNAVTAYLPWARF